MNGCNHYQELISRMLDEDLNKAEKNELAEHIKRCPDCAAVYVAFRSLSEHIGEELEEPSPDLHEKIMSDVRREALRAKNSLSVRHRRIRTLTTVAACLVLLVAAALSFPKIMERSGAKRHEASEAAVLTEESAPEAEEPMLFASGVTQSDSASRDAVTNAIPQSDALPEAPAEAAVEEIFEAAAEPEPRYAGFVETRSDGTLVLDKVKSEELELLMSGKELAPGGTPDREIRLIYLHRGEERELTVLLYGETAVYVPEKDDASFLFDADAEELLELLELSD